MNVVSFCTLGAGLLGIKHAVNLGVYFEKIIGVDPNIIKLNDKVSGFVDIKKFCEKFDINYQYVDDYSLKSFSPYKLYSQPDIIWVGGWQRLLPENFIMSSRHADIRCSWKL